MIISRTYPNDDYVFGNVRLLLIMVSGMIIVVFLLKYKDKVKLWYLNVSNNIWNCFRILYKPSGLRNTSAFCYMNSMIQAAAASNVLVSKLKQLQHECRQSESLSAFVELIDGINRSGNSDKMIDTNTEQMAKLIRLIGWNKPSQQDAFDLFAALIKVIHDELKKSGKVDIQMPLKVKLVHRFTGMDIPDKVQDHLGLSVGLCGNYSESSGVSLEYLIKEHFSPTIIDDDPSKTTQMFFYQQAPDLLLIHIQANKWDHGRGEMYKPEYYIKYKNDIDLQLNIFTDTGIEKHDVRYKLKSVVKHSGTISGGHYVTYREYKDRWYLVNDEQVTQKAFDNTVVPYIMIYEKRQFKKYSYDHLLNKTRNFIQNGAKNMFLSICKLFRKTFLCEKIKNNQIVKII